MNNYEHKLRQLTNQITYYEKTQPIIKEYLQLKKERDVILNVINTE